jgi:hypothetical protein
MKKNLNNLILINEKGYVYIFPWIQLEKLRKSRWHTVHFHNWKFEQQTKGSVSW